MKYTYTLALVALLVGCSPDETKPTQSYLGVYQEVYQTSVELSGTSPVTSTRSGSVTLTNGLSPGEIAIGYPDGTAVLIQTSGNQFTFSRPKDPNSDFTRIGSGQFTQMGYQYQYTIDYTSLGKYTVTATGTRQ